MSWWQLLVVLGFALLLLLGRGVWWLYQRGVALRADALLRARYLDALRYEFPEAFEVLSSFDRNKGLETLTESHPDLEQAVNEIKNYARREFQARKQIPSLKISPQPASGGDSKKLKAALVTIVRGIYTNPENVDVLGEGGEDALDAFMSSLVE